MKSDEILLALSLKFNGDWEQIYRALVARETSDLEPYLLRAQRMRCQYITILSEQYPPQMRCQRYPPFVLFYHGDLSLLNDINKNVAVIGSRECTEYGERMTEQIVSEISDEYIIVSGLARGIDRVAHEAAIKSGGKTIAVLGNGVDFIYLNSNKDLYEDIKKNHLVISEYPFCTPPSPTSFPMRNRIIAMITKGIVVTEAYAKSGTLITVMHALQTQRAVLCVPYPADAKSECNRLISEGAYLVENGENVKEILKTEIAL